MSEDDARWQADAARYGWKLGHVAPWPLRLPVIRFVRWAWLDYRVRSYAGAWAAAGIGLGGPNQRDLWVLYAIRRGWA